MQNAHANSRLYALQSRVLTDYRRRARHELDTPCHNLHKPPPIPHMHLAISLCHSFLKEPQIAITKRLRTHKQFRTPQVPALAR